MRHGHLGVLVVFIICSVTSILYLSSLVGLFCGQSYIARSSFVQASRSLGSMEWGSLFTFGISYKVISFLSMFEKPIRDVPIFRRAGLFEQESEGKP